MTPTTILSVKDQDTFDKSLNLPVLQYRMIETCKLAHRIYDKNVIHDLMEFRPDTKTSQQKRCS